MHVFDLTNIIQIAGYPGIFAMIFAESGVIVGFFLPGASLLFTAGFLASQDFFDIRILIPLVAIAAILGDNVGYWFGAKVGIRLFDRPDSRLFKHEYLERTQQFYARYGTRTILFARFVPVVRTFAPILAGVAGMEYRAFFIYNVVGGIVWGSGVTYAGYVLSRVFPQSGNYIELVVLGIVFITTLPLFVEFLRRKKHGKSATLPRAVIFDLDDTLAESHQAPEAHMIERLGKLLKYVPVAIMSAADFPRVEQNFLPALAASPHAARLYVFSNNAAKAHVWKDNGWHLVYAYPLTQEERTKIIAAIKAGVIETNIDKNTSEYAPQILEREAKVVFTPFAVDAPQSQKRAWDPDLSKRNTLKTALDRRLPEFEISIGGTSTIDVTRKGISKRFGVESLAKTLGIEPKEMLFVGDALYKGGNDAMVIPTGIQTKQVAGPTTTAEVIDELLASFAKR